MRKQRQHQQPPPSLQQNQQPKTPNQNALSSPSLSNSNQSQSNKQKLISKTHIQSKQDQFQVNSTVTNSKPAPQIQILSRNSNLNNPNSNANNKNLALSSLANTGNQTSSAAFNAFSSPQKSNPPENYASLFKQQQQSSSTLNQNKSQNYQKNNSSLMEILKNSSFSNKQTPQVPVGTTTELSPAPSSLPIPIAFGFSSSSSSSRRNILLEQLGISSSSNTVESNNRLASAANSLVFSQDFLNSTSSLPVGLHQSSSSHHNNPLALLGLTAQSVEQHLLNSSNSTPAPPPPPSQQNSISSDFEKFSKLNKINKLRDLLRADGKANKHTFTNNNYDLIEYFKSVCDENGIKLNYVQYVMSENAGYYGEIFLESFRIICEKNKKRKKCMYFAYKNALELLCSSSELAVKVAPKQKRDANIRLSQESAADFTSDSFSYENNLSNGTSDVDFEYELYRVDSNQGIVRTSSNRHIVNTVANIENESMSLPPVLEDLFKNNIQQQKNLQQNEQPTLHDLNLMLKSMILPKFGAKPQENTAITSTVGANGNSVVSDKQNQSNSAKETDENENDDDDDDEKSEGMDKRTKYLNLNIVITL
jgi:hypothetical protein